MMKNITDHPAVQQLREHSTQATEAARDVVERHNSAMAMLATSFLKAQAEMVRGVLAVIEHQLDAMKTTSKK